MPQIGAREAKTRLPQLLKRVEQGERFVITRHGRPVAELIPLGEISRGRVREAIEDLKAFQKTHSLQGLLVRDLIEEGRKY
ncbi:type II toxin-antitoxin system Phd/YefM family antitoxin [Deferrisoma camini]|uniref:type II toxin-antitoxin system Phd/YefM family antitoxin n=1 Tax=Deferrisoma camini TaxID=1035120 RepID=UPI00046C948A|nr:type II toxin-antitoxin system prevent-host-death family antitoxin [Deferrisoma camini]